MRVRAARRRPMGVGPSSRAALRPWPPGWGDCGRHVADDLGGLVRPPESLRRGSRVLDAVHSSSEVVRVPSVTCMWARRRPSSLTPRSWLEDGGSGLPSPRCSVCNSVPADLSSARSLPTREVDHDIRLRSLGAQLVGGEVGLAHVAPELATSHCRPGLLEAGRG